MTTKIDISTIRQDDVPYPKHLMSEIEEKLRSFGYSVNLTEECQVPEYSDLADNSGRTPDWITGANNPIREGMSEGWAYPFDLEALATEKWENVDTSGEGSSHVTTYFNHLELTVMEVIDYLELSGQIEESIETISQVTGDKVTPENAVAYAIWTYSRGWVAEKLITETDRFSKLWVTNDQAGQDALDNLADKYVQVKCVTFDNQKDDHLYYQWDMRGGLHIGENLKEVYKAAAKVSGRPTRGGDMPGTVTYRTHSSYTDENGNPYRYLWW